MNLVIYIYIYIYIWGYEHINKQNIWIGWSEHRHNEKENWTRRCDVGDRRKKNTGIMKPKEDVRMRGHAKEINWLCELVRCFYVGGLGNG